MAEPKKMPNFKEIAYAESMETITAFISGGIQAVANRAMQVNEDRVKKEYAVQSLAEQLSKMQAERDELQKKLDELETVKPREE